MENDPFIDDVPIKMVIVHGYVKQPFGVTTLCWMLLTLSDFLQLHNDFKEIYFLHARIIS